jgi:hypothetical protein
MRYLLTMSARNEGDTIASVISEFLKEANKLNISLNIHVIDDNSRDKPYSIVRDLGIPVFSIDGHGLAESFKKEIEIALMTDADYFIHIDADGQHSSADLINFIIKISEGYDLVLGNRLHIRPIGMSIFRYYGNIFFSKIVSILANKVISDSQTGYRLMHRDLAKSCMCITSKFTYTQEQIIRAAINNFRIGEVPIVARPRKNGKSRLVKNPFYYLFRVFIDLKNLVV